MTNPLNIILMIDKGLSLVVYIFHTGIIP